MKKIILLLLVAAFAASCSVDEYTTPRVNGMIRIEPSITAWAASNLRSFSAGENLTPLDVVKKTTAMRFMYNGIECTRMFPWAQKDTINASLLMLSTDVIGENGELILEFIEASGVVIEVWENPYSGWSQRDTVAYIPDSLLRDAEIKIKDAYAAEDFDSVQVLFHDVYKFLPK
jgi:hypothetical protein